MRFKAHPVTLPLPFPRMFSRGVFNEHGLQKPELEESKDSTIKDEFVTEVPVMARLRQDSSYLPCAEQAYLKLKQVRPAVRMLLLRDFMEEDELREVIENLANLVEDFKGIQCEGSDASSKQSSSSDNEY